MSAKLDKWQVAGAYVITKHLQGVIVTDKGIAQTKHHALLQVQEHTSWNSELLQDGDQGPTEVHWTFAISDFEIMPMPSEKM